MSDPVLDFVAAATEMCEAWDSLRAMLDGTEKASNYSLDEGRREVIRRTARMCDARNNLAAAAPAFGELIGV